MAGKKGRSGTTKGCSGPKRTPEQRERDQDKMMELLRRGWTKTMIAKELKIGHTQVTYDYKIVVRQLRDMRNEDTKEYIRVKLEEYGELKREAWQAWERSKLDHQKRTTEELPDRDCNYCKGTGLTKKGGECGSCQGLGVIKGSSKVTTAVEGQSGDSSYLQIVLNCLKAERDLLALDPPKEVEVKGQVNSVNWEVFTEGIPLEGPVPDRVEAEIRRVMDLGPPLPAPSPPDATPIPQETTPAADQTPLLPGERGGNGAAH